MLLSKELTATYIAAYTVSSELYISTLVLENGQEIVITDEMVKNECSIEDSIYRQVAEEIDEYVDEEV
ncbi:MAG: hypothetical protein V2J55_03950 [Candidatus Competibacteraceae bacterium]|jgi:hypothetical protein|nr:hypothetical protein [Candidatus Competibacteraceae bacterium]